VFRGESSLAGGTAGYNNPGMNPLQAISGGIGLAGQAMGAAAMVMPFLGLSSEKLKEDIVPLDSCLEKVCQLQGVEFTWKGTRVRDAGLIAERVGEVVPEASAKIMGYDGISVLALVGYLVESVKELRQEIVELKAQKE